MFNFFLNIAMVTITIDDLSDRHFIFLYWYNIWTLFWKDL